MSAPIATAPVRRFRSRGRPRSPHPEHDPGTPELNLKKALHLTTETLDLLMERQLLTSQQHWCGLHLRWLYTLRYGLPGITALDPTRSHGLAIRDDNVAWRSEREQEYLEAVTILRGQGVEKAALDYCVFNQGLPTPASTPARPLQITLPKALDEALSLLVTLWC